MPELKEIEAAARTIFSLMLQINQAQIHRVPLDGVFPYVKVSYRVSKLKILGFDVKVYEIMFVS